MRFSVVLAFAAAAMAAPAPVDLEQRQTPICSGATSPYCCATDVLNLADLNCETPPTSPTSINNFISTCAAEGQQAKCCILSLLGQALFCSDVNPQPTTAA